MCSIGEVASVVDPKSQALPAAAEKMAPSVTKMDPSSDISASFPVLCRFNEMICWILKDLKKTSNTVRLWIGLEILVGRFLPFSAQAIHEWSTMTDKTKWRPVPAKTVAWPSNSAISSVKCEEGQGKRRKRS